MIGDGAVDAIGSYVTLTTTSNNQKVSWTAHQAVGTNQAAGAVNLILWPCWKDSSATTWNLVGSDIAGITAKQGDRQIVSIGGVVAPGAGTHNYTMCYETFTPNWDINEWGYVTAERHL